MKEFRVILSHKDLTAHIENYGKTLFTAKDILDGTDLLSVLDEAHRMSAVEPLRLIIIISPED